MALTAVRVASRRRRNRKFIIQGDSREVICQSYHFVFNFRNSGSHTQISLHWPPANIVGWHRDNDAAV